MEEEAAVAAEALRSDRRKEFTLQWHITHRCNLRCKHCYQHDYRAFSDRESLRRVLTQYEALLAAYGFRGHLNITGGEPMLHPDIFWLLEEAARRGMTAAVLTNGTTLTLRDAKYLKMLGVTYAQVSLDGCEQTHDAIRGKGSFQRAVNGIRALKAMEIYTDVSFTAQRNNLSELKPLSKICGSLGVDKLWFDRVIIPVREDEEKLTLSAEEYRALCKTAALLNRRHKVSCARALQFLPCRSKSIYRCTAGEALLTILADGSVLPCRRLPIVVGNVNETDLLSIYRDSGELKRIRETPVPDGCGSCSYREQCRGGAKCLTFAKTGRYDLRDPDCPVKRIF